MTRAAVAIVGMLVVAATTAGCGDDGRPASSTSPATGGTARVDAPSARIGLAILAPAPALILSADGIKDGAAACPTVAIEVVERNAENDLPALTSIAEGFLADDLDLIATVSTPAAQAAFQVVGAAGGTTPVVFSTVNDPFTAGLAESPTVHEPWITGTQSLPPLAEVIDAMVAVVPDVATAGVVYNPAEPNSQLVVDGLQAIADDRGIAIEAAAVTSSGEVAEAAVALASRDIDAFVVPTDGTVVTGMAGLVQVAGDNDLPVIGTDVSMAQTGAAVGLGADYYAAGVRAGEIACEVLSGASPADFDVVNIEAVRLAVNVGAADAQNASIPDELLERAEVVG